LRIFRCLLALLRIAFQSLGELLPLGLRDCCQLSEEPPDRLREDVALYACGHVVELGDCADDWNIPQDAVDKHRVE
jgi:hypothetical protein